MYFALKFILLATLIITETNVYAQSEEPPPPQQAPQTKEPDIFAPNDLTPNLSPRSNLWTDTSPELQVGLAVGDVLFLGYSKQLFIPEFRKAAQIYRAQNKKELRAKAVFQKAEQKVVSEQKSLQELQATRDSLDKSADAANTQIEQRTEALKKAELIITADEKEIEIARVKGKMVNLYSKAIQEHQGALNTQEDMYRSLTAKEREEVLVLKEQYNAYREMPNVNLEQKAVIVRDAEAALQTAKDEHAGYIEKMRQVKIDIDSQSLDIEQWKAQLSDLESKYKIEQQSAELLKRDMDYIGHRWGLRRIGYSVLRIGGRIIVGVDLGGRILYYFVAQQDPGWFPFAKILQRIL